MAFEIDKIIYFLKNSDLPSTLQWILYFSPPTDYFQIEYKQSN